MTVSDIPRAREIPIRIYLPSPGGAAPVILFSHGLGGSREGSAYLGRHWARRGYAAVFLQHPGSDRTVWQEAPVAHRMDAMREAANAANFLLRVKDVSAVLDQLEKWNTTADHPLHSRLEMDRVGMSGHSFGAVTTQAVSGQSAAAGRSLFQDPRIDAAVIMSPSSPRRGDPESAFGSVDIPWLLMTGTRDIAAIGQIDLKSRLAVFPALPPGGKYELILKDAEHSAFTERALPGEKAERNPNHHRVILALSTAFWDAWLRGDASARDWIESDAPQSLLHSGDSWKSKPVSEKAPL